MFLRYIDLYFFYSSNFFLQLPDAFQELLSNEKTPVLSETLLAFEGLLSGLKELMSDLRYYQLSNAIEEGIEKLSNYKGRIDFNNVPICWPHVSFHYLF